VIDQLNNMTIFDPQRERYMPSVNVKIKYSSIGSAPTSTTKISVQVSRRPPTESEVSAAIQKAHPKWNFIILEID
jgi:hypothetical protein